ncbi:MAG: hypothetical protein N3A38_13885 [Planctomycetota bacterium]|nr:hypothetical protein [Planctomycetota bacterium]
MRTRIGIGGGERGSALVLALVFVTVLMMMCLGFASRVKDTSESLEYGMAEARAMEIAQAAVKTNMQKIWADFVASAGTRPDPRDRVVWLAVTSNDSNNNRERDGGEPAAAIEGTAYNRTWFQFGQGEATISSRVFGSVPADRSYVDLELQAAARVFSGNGDPTNKADRRGWAYKTVRMVVRYNFIQPSRVFDFAYFANNYGWMYDNGSGCIKLFGGMGANGNLGFAGAPWVDGLLFAALNPALNAAGVVNGLSCVRYHNLADYKAFVASQPAERRALMPPTNPAYTEDANGNGLLDPGEDANGNGTMDRIDYPAGYDGTVSTFQKQAPLDMPYLGDLARYKELALREGGTIKQLRPGGNPNNEADWEVVVNGVYGDDPSEVGLMSTVDGAGKIVRTAVPADKKLETDPAKQDRNGNVALIGTDAQPLKITGPVVITNDLVIRGRITGRGSIYVGRNTHIVGNVTYVNPPQWQQNDPNFYNTLQTNNNDKDMVGFATKGSVIVGQYYRMARSDKPAGGGMYDDSDAWGTARYYFRTGFQDAMTQSYQTDPTDQAIGYYDPVTKKFHGDYTANDGGTRYDSTDLTARIARKYYESSFPDSYIQSISTGRPEKIHGIFYTNHLFGGRPQNFEMFGSLVCRDEGIVFNNYAYFYYDCRSSSNSLGSRATVYLPAASGYRVWLWQEIPSR